MEFRGQDEEQHKQVYVLCRMQIREWSTDFKHMLQLFYKQWCVMTTCYLGPIIHKNEDADMRWTTEYSDKEDEKWQ